MRLRSWRQTPAISPPLRATPRRRSLPWARVLLAALLAGVAAYLLIPHYFFLSADALVDGDLVPLAPLYRAKIEQISVHCGDHVQAGQPVAVVSNFLIESDYDRENVQNSQQEEMARITLMQGVAQAELEEETARQKYLAAVQAAQRKGELFHGYDVSYRENAIGRIEWESIKGEYEAAQADAESLRQAWNAAAQHVGVLRSQSTELLADQQKQVQREQSLASRVKAEPLTAPVSGNVVDCKARPGMILEAGSPMFTVFGTDRAYVMGFFNPNDAGKIKIGEDVAVDIKGAPRTLHGRVAVVYPDLQKLPPELTRFFWEHVQWSEYRPVKITFPDISQQTRELLTFGAQARVRIRLRETPHFPLNFNGGSS